MLTYDPIAYEVLLYKVGEFTDAKKKVAVNSLKLNRRSQTIV